MPRPYADATYRALERSFAKSVYLREAEVKELSQELGLSSVQLLNWFKNRRRRGARVYDTSRTPEVQSGTLVRVQQPVNLELVVEEAKSYLSECDNNEVEEDDAIVDWQELQHILESVVPPEIIDERYICRRPRYPGGGSIQSAAEPNEWRVVGYSSNLDELTMGPRMAVWLKELFNAVSVDVTTLQLYTVCPKSGAIIWDQNGSNSSLALEPWYQEIIEPMKMKDGRWYGMGRDVRPWYEGRCTSEEGEGELRWQDQYGTLRGGNADCTMQIGRERYKALLEKVVHDLVPSKFDESHNPEARYTTGNKSQFSLPVLAMDGTLEGVVWIGTRHPVDDPALNAFVDSVALSLRSTCRLR